MGKPKLATKRKSNLQTGRHVNEQACNGIKSFGELEADYALFQLYEQPTADRAAASAPRLEVLRRGGITRHRCPYLNHPAAVTTEFGVFKKAAKNAPFATFSRRAYISKPRMYGMTGGRGPVLKSGPRVER
jgi:hypothetical protein